MRKVFSDWNWDFMLNDFITMEFYSFYDSPAPGYPIERRQPSLPSSTAGMTSDNADEHTSSCKGKKYEILLCHRVLWLSSLIINLKELDGKFRLFRFLSLCVDHERHSLHVIFHNWIRIYIFILWLLSLLSLIYHSGTCAKSS